ncbi:Gp49 family protein [Delftia lacustris]|uniref:Gp49 family protein n=1 Tax=Delftia lacustris TaxID=558537 RepID=UPI001EF101AD|nr:Gp49 family protein [Delftia lacustris]
MTPADIEAEIAREHYFTAEQGAKHPDGDAKPYDFGDVWKSSNLGALTFCVLVLKNGTKVVGINYGAIDPAQHDAARGRQEARAQAVEKVWELLGFRLRDKLAAGA